MHKKSTVNRKQVVPQLIGVRRRFFGETFVIAKAILNLLD
jgi:hypothetical protein